MTSSTLPAVTRETWLGHPKGLYLLFATEMWERVSYYGMRALLVLSLVAGVETANPGFGWTQSRGARALRALHGLRLLDPADRRLPRRQLARPAQVVIIGGLVMGPGSHLPDVPGRPQLFYVGLSLLIFGNGFFKPNISTMVGGSTRRATTTRRRLHDLLHGNQLGRAARPFVCSTSARIRITAGATATWRPGSA